MRRKVMDNETRASTLLPGATFKSAPPHHIGSELNGKCERHLCPFNTITDALGNEQGACVTLPCPWKNKHMEGS
jgi:hypothetical protein